jgi:hypothetical protein
MSIGTGQARGEWLRICHKNCYNTVMLVVDYLRWWYGRGWSEVSLFFAHRIQKTARDFSLAILIRTLLKPWRQTIETGQRTLGDRLRAGVGNIVSRGVGFSVRLGALIIASILIFCEGGIALIIMIIWPLMPLTGIGLILWGLV